MRNAAMTIGAICLGSLFAAGAFAAPAMAATVGAPAPAPAAGLPCSGVWKLNEQLTRRTRSAPGPYYQFFESWGPDGWMRMNTGDISKPTNSSEWHFEQFNDKPYQVFGGDPSLQHSRRISDRIIGTTRVRAGEEANLSFVVFTEDCKRVTYYFPEGQDRHGPPGKNHFYNDLRVFDRIEPPAGAAPVADVFGGWMLNRTASKLTQAPMDAETVVIVPWGRNGWIWNQISGGSYQPEDLKKNVTRVECGATEGVTARPCQGPKPAMMLYWASWDSKTFPTYGSVPRHVQLKRLNERGFDVVFLDAAQKPDPAGKASVVFSPDGQHLTVTRSGAGGANDVRVYDRINAAGWPTVKP